MMKELGDLTRRGITAAEKGDSFEALVHLENAQQIEKTPLVSSYLGYCLAKERGQMKDGASMCLDSIKQNPGDPIFYLNLGRIYALAGERSLAIRTLRKGLKMGCDNRIIAELRGMGIRKGPVFHSLARTNPLNKYCGLLFARLGMR